MSENVTIQTNEQVTISKAVGPLLVSAALALYAYYTGVGELAAVVTPIAGIGTFGAVYLARYAANKYNKTIAAFLVPLGVALLQGFTSNDWGQPELVLAIQAILSAAAAYGLNYVTDVPAVNQQDKG
jgi:hypothetical protein